MLKVSQKLCVFSVRKLHLNPIGIVGVPFAKGQTKGGVAVGPKAIRDAGLVKKISEIRKVFSKICYKNYTNFL